MADSNSLGAGNPIEVSKGGTQNSASLTDGQLWVGSTGNPPALATLTAGTNMSVVNAPGSITLNAAAPAPSPIVQQLITESSATPNTTSVFSSPALPGQGLQVLSRAITPTSLTNRIWIDVACQCTATNANGRPAIILVEDGTVIGYTSEGIPGGGAGGANDSFNFRIRMTRPIASLVSKTYEVRMAYRNGSPVTGTVNLNTPQNGNAGKVISSISVQEVTP